MTDPTCTDCAPSNNEMANALSDRSSQMAQDDEDVPRRVQPVLSYDSLNVSTFTRPAPLPSRSVTIEFCNRVGSYAMI